MIYRLALLALALAACSDDTNIGPDPTDGNAGGSTMNSPTGAGGTGGDGGTGGASNMQGLGYENGTRLRARNVVGADGSKQFLRWHDTQLDADCFFGKASDGSTRCLPSPVGAATVSTFFADAACTVPAVSAFCSNQAAPTFAFRDVAACGPNGVESTREVLRVGDPVTQLYQGNPCVLSAEPIDGYYEATVEPPTSFVEGEESVD
jgi:hypothetical protein